MDRAALILFDFDAFKEEAIAAAPMPEPVASIGASFAWAVAPTDATTAGRLLECADQRLLYRKRLNKTAF